MAAGTEDYRMNTDNETEKHVDEMMNTRPDAPDPFADETTERLVDSIVVRESDELLSRHSHDPIRGATVMQPLPRRGGLRRFSSAWWHNGWARWGTGLALLAVVIAFGALPTSRYYALNTAGVRSKVTLSITDQSTLQPLKNVTVQIGDRHARTNQDGLVKLSEVQLGPQPLTISQAGFATITRTITLGLGSNPLGDFALQPVGKQFRFKLVDYLSGKPVKSAEISRGDSNAQADKNGQVVLTIDQNDTAADKAIISGDGYRLQSIGLEAGQKQSRTIVMVPAAKEVFMSKQSGKYDLYKMDIDGRNKQVLLAASGYEDTDITVAMSDDGKEAAVVSKRDNTFNQDGYRLQTLTLVSIDKGTILTLDHSEQIRIVDWADNRLVYVKVKAGTSAGNPERYQMVSYDYQTIARNQLASANYFNDIVAGRGTIYYAASNNFQGGVSQFASIKADGSDKKVLLDKTDVWNISRTSADSLNLSALQATYAYKFGDDTVRKLSDSAAPPSDTRFYLDASDGRQALWTDSRDGKGFLLVYSAASGKDTTITSQTGLTYPIRRLDARTILYRVVTPTETADYAVSLDGGAPRKVTDLTNATGLGAWNRR